MYRTIPTMRKAGVAALVALTAVSGLVFAPSAAAAPAVAGDLTLVAGSQPAVGVGKANQPAGTEKLTITAGDTLTSGDQILIKVDDSDNSTCLVGDTVAFSSLPTVAVTGTATILSTLEASGLPSCGNNQLRLNVTGSGTASITISGIAYTVGAAASPGAVQVNGTLNGVGIVDAGASNAFITTAILTANNPPLGASQQPGGAFTVSPLVITEQTASGADGGLCIYFNDDIEGTPAPTPTVAVAGGTDTATVTASPAGDYLFVDVSPSGIPSTSTFTISGVPLERDDTGVKTATLFADDNDTCDDGDGPRLSNATNVGGVTFVGRHAGSDRYTTAQLLFEDEFTCNDWAVIARADQFPDALAASYLAGHAETGILLTDTNSIPQSTLNAIRNEGVDHVYLMGGTSAISAAVATQLDNTVAHDCGGGPTSPASTLTVQRIGGVDRFGTARLAAEFPGLGQAGFADTNNDGDDNDAARTAIVASGLNFPDALAAGALASGGDETIGCCETFGGPLPLLLTHPTAVPPDTLAALANLSITNVLVVGGTGAVSDAAVAQLTSAGLTVRRIAGVNRQATAIALATAMFKEFGYDSDSLVLVRGDDYADALVGGPVAGSSWGEAILLTGSPSDLSTDLAALLRTWNATFGVDVTVFDIFGGTSAVSAAVVQAALNAASQQ